MYAGGLPLEGIPKVNYMYVLGQWRVAYSLA